MARRARQGRHRRAHRVDSRRVAGARPACGRRLPNPLREPRLVRQSQTARSRPGRVGRTVHDLRRRAPSFGGRNPMGIADEPARPQSRAVSIRWHSEKPGGFSSPLDWCRQESRPRPTGNAPRPTAIGHAFLPSSTGPDSPASGELRGVHDLPAVAFVRRTISLRLAMERWHAAREGGASWATWESSARQSRWRR